MNEVYEIGNGQTCNTDLHKVCGSLDCMHDQKAILIGGGNERHTDYRESPTGFESETYGYSSIAHGPNGNRGG